MTDTFQIAVGLALSLFSIGSAVAVGIVAGRRHGSAIGITAGTTLLVGLQSAGTALAHLIAVIWTATGRGGTYSYNFRFAALLLIGILILIAGALNIASVRGLVRGQASAWGRAMSGTLLLLVVNVPLVPVQTVLAGGLSILGTVNLVALVRARQRLVRVATASSRPDETP